MRREAGCPRCRAEWTSIGPEGGDCPKDGFVPRAEFEEDGQQSVSSASNGQQPVPTAISLGQLLGKVYAFIRRYVVLSDFHAVAISLWVLHTWAIDAAEATPYLSITSAEKRSGKTRLLEVLELLVARPWQTGRISAAALVRTIERKSPTLLLDEADAAFKREREYVEAVRGILNDGYRRGKKATLCIPPKWEPADFSVFCPKAIASIGRLPDTVMDRSIVINLKRRAPGESVARFKWRETRKEARPLGEQLEHWAAFAIAALRDARPDIPELDDRAADVWEPLLAIADAAGGDWPQRARKAALALSVGDGRDDDSLGVRLLADIRTVFQGGVERLASAGLVQSLVAMEESPWGDLRGRPLDNRGLARRLRPYEIRPHNVRLKDGRQAKGYEASDFTDAWSRYIPQISVPSVPSVPNEPVESDSATVIGTVGTDGTANPEIEVVSNGDNDGQALYVLSLAELLGWPALSLGQRYIDGHTVSVGVPGDRFAWEQAARFWPDNLLGELLTRLEEMACQAQPSPTDVPA